MKVGIKLSFKSRFGKTSFEKEVKISTCSSQDL